MHFGCTRHIESVAQHRVEFGAALKGKQLVHRAPLQCGVGAQGKVAAGRCIGFHDEPLPIQGHGVHRQVFKQATVPAHGRLGLHLRRLQILVLDFQLGLVDTQLLDQPQRVHHVVGHSGLAGRCAAHRGHGPLAQPLNFHVHRSHA